MTSSRASSTCRTMVGSDFDFEDRDKSIVQANGYVPLYSDDEDSISLNDNLTTDITSVDDCPCWSSDNEDSIPLDGDMTTVIASANDYIHWSSDDDGSTTLHADMMTGIEQPYKGAARKINGIWKWEDCYENDQKIAQYLGFDHWHEWQKFRFSAVCLKWYSRFSKHLAILPKASQLEYLLEELTSCLCEDDCHQAPCITKTTSAPSSYNAKTWEQAIVQYNANLYRYGEPEHEADVLAANLLILFRNDLLSPIQVDEKDQRIQDEIVAWRFVFQTETEEYGDGGRTIPPTIPSEYIVRPSLGPHIRHGETIAEPYVRLWQLLLNIQKDVVSKDKWYRSVHGTFQSSEKPDHMKTSVFPHENDWFAEHGYFG